MSCRASRRPRRLPQSVHGLASRRSTNPVRALSHIAPHRSKASARSQSSRHCGVKITCISPSDSRDAVTVDLKIASSTVATAVSTISVARSARSRLSWLISSVGSSPSPVGASPSSLIQTGDDHCEFAPPFPKWAPLRPGLARVLRRVSRLARAVLDFAACLVHPPSRLLPSILALRRRSSSVSTKFISNSQVALKTASHF